MLNIEDRISAFVRLGIELNSILEKDLNHLSGILREQNAYNIADLIENSGRYNGWFTEVNVRYMFKSVADSLNRKNIDKWLKQYTLDMKVSHNPKNIATIMAGNVPLVGFHDFLTVLISGNKITAKLSSDDNKLLPALAALLIDIEPAFEEKISFRESKLSDFDAVIATGSNNTARYFHYYFGKYPNIIRKNRNGIAVLTGNETIEELQLLSDDIFLYYGLGCRNVSKLLVPKNYDFNLLLETFSERIAINESHKYFNNYEYNKAIYLVNSTPHFDTGNLMLIESEKISSPVSVVNYEYYNSKSDMLKYLNENDQFIQCIVSNIVEIENRTDFGSSQIPELWEYADGIDTMNFLLALDNQ